MSTGKEDKDDRKLYKVRKGTKDIELPRKWAIIESYLDQNLSVNDIAEKYGMSRKKCQELITQTYRRFQNVRETNMLITTQNRPEDFERFKKEHLDPERINKEFISQLSEETSLALTVPEMIFCEFFVSNGDEVKALKESGLDAGLNKTDNKSYKEALTLRSFYLRRKRNVAQYIKELQVQQVEVLKGGKDHIQAELMAIIERSRNNGDPRAVPHMIKALEMLGKTIGAFEEKHTIETVGGDDALNRILNKAKQAQIIDIPQQEPKTPIAYVDGEEIYSR